MSIHKTIKLPLKHILTERRHLEKLHDAVIRTNKIAIHTMQFIKLYFIYLTDSNRELPILDKDFISKVIGVVSQRNNAGRKVRKNIELNNLLNIFYEEHYKQLLIEEKVSSTNLNTPLDYLAQQLEVCYKNNIIRNYKNYIARYINKFGSKIYYKNNNLNEDYKLNKEEKSKMYSELKKIKEDIMLYRFNELKSNEQYHEFINNIKQWIVPNNIENNDGGLYYNVFVNPHKYLKCMILINKELEKINVKLFNPLCLRNSCIPKYIKIDTTTLKDLFFELDDIKQIATIYSLTNLKNKADFRKALNELKEQPTKQKNHRELHVFNTKLWRYIFKFSTNKYNTSLLQQGKYVFNNSILTDGYGVSLLQIRQDMTHKHYLQHKENNNNDDEIKFEYLEDNTNLENYKLLSCDPGKKCLLMITDGNKTFRYTQQQRAHECRFKQNKKKIVWLKNNKYYENKSINNIEQEIKYNSKSCNIDNIKQYIKDKLILNEKTQILYNDIIMRKLRFNIYSHTKQSEDKLLNNINKKFKENKELCILHGDWSKDNKGNKMKHMVSTPNIGLINKLKQKIKVLLINEYKTSKTCHACFGENEYCKTRQYYKNNQLKTTNVHGLLRCKNESCGKYWNRDVNASKNILLVGKYYIENKIYPEAFRRC